MRVVDLFAGGGGMSLGFALSGFEIAAAFDNWKAAADCCRLNFSHPVTELDLSGTDEAVSAVSEFLPDIIIGGPPCQDFSFAGNRREGRRANLTVCFARIVAQIQPWMFVMENVPAAQKSAAYTAAADILRSAGYGLTEVILDACLCGVPQRRRRLICFGVLGGDDGEAQTYFAPGPDSRPMTVRECFGDALRFTFYYYVPRNYSRRAIFSVDEPAPTMRGINRSMSPGYRGHPADACPPDGNVHNLTTQDRARIQTFPESYRWTGSRTNVEQIIGNAVPVNLARFIAGAVRRFIQNEFPALTA